MRRAFGLLALAAAFLFLSPNAGAATPVTIPGTPIQVVDLSPTAVVVAAGANASFSWEVFNSGTVNYVMTARANASDPSVLVSVSPSNFTVRRGSLLEVGVNVTASTQAAAQGFTVLVRFSTLSPVASSVQVSANVVVQTAAPKIDVLTAFVAIGAIIAIGFAATLIFERTQIPDLLILILLGILLGPVVLVYSGVALVPGNVLEAATPYFAALALMIILFDGGLNLSLRQIVKRLGIVGLHTGVAFLLTVFSVAAIAATVLGYPLLVGLLLGAIIGGTSSAVVIGIVRRLPVSEDTKVILTLESVITDVLCVVSVIALIELLRGGPNGSVAIVFVELIQRFGVAFFLAGIAGVTWLLLLRRVEKKPFAYMLTIAVLFVLYGITEFAHGSGAMASFVFGLILGNHAELAKRFHLPSGFVVDEHIKQFHSELSFVVRTFFFVFLGFVFTFQFGGAWRVSTSLAGLNGLNGTFALFLIGVTLIFVAIVIVRMLTAMLTAHLRSKPPAERRVLWSLMGRGLAAAVLASLPFTMPAFTSPSSTGDLYYRSVMAPFQIQFLNIVLYIILLTVLATTLGVAASARSLGISKPTAPLAEPTLGFWTHWDDDVQRLADPSETPSVSDGGEDRKTQLYDRRS
jgi:cell volume regulation protein A